MKGIVRLAPLAFVAALLVSCAAAIPLPADSSKPIEPGERIGGVTVTKGEGDDILYLWRGMQRKNGYGRLLQGHRGGEGQRLHGGVR
jgi:hypothetical protein